MQESNNKTKLPTTIAYEGLNTAQSIAVEYLATTTKSQREVAKIVDVREQTISEWKRLPQFTKAIEERRSQFLKDNRPAVDTKLVDKASKGEDRAMELFYRLTGDLNKDNRIGDSRPSIQINILDVPNQGRTVDITPDRKE